MNPIRIVGATLVAAALAACAPTATQTSSPSAAPTNATLETAAPAVAITPAAATASPSPTPGVPTRAPTAPPTPLIIDANAPPQILSYSLSAATVNVGDTVSGVVLTSSNVASVQADVASYVMPLTKTGIGRFALSYVVPNIPKPFRGTYALKIIAHNAAGVTANASTSITIK